MSEEYADFEGLDDEGAGAPRASLCVPTAAAAQQAGRSSPPPCNTHLSSHSLHSGDAADQEQQFEGADMADAGQQQHEQQQHEQQQQPLRTAESDALQQLDEDGDQPSADAAAAAVPAGVARLSMANSEAAEDNLLSGLADDDDDSPAGAHKAADAAGTATDADLEALPDSVKQSMTATEADAFAQQLAGKVLNARQRRTLNRLIARGQGLGPAAARLGLDANGTGEGGEQQQQQTQQHRQPKVRAQRLGLRELVRACCSRVCLAARSSSMGTDRLLRRPWFTWLAAAVPATASSLPQDQQHRPVPQQPALVDH